MKHINAFVAKMQNLVMLRTGDTERQHQVLFRTKIGIWHI